MPIIELPDGREIEFPDDMDSSAISTAIQKNFPEFAPKEEKSFLSRAADRFGEVVEANRDMASGVVDTLGDIRQGIRRAAGTLPEQIEQERAQRRDRAGVMSGINDKPLPAASQEQTVQEDQAVDPGWANALPNSDTLASVMQRTKDAYSRPSLDMIDPNAEARARRFVRQGVGGDVANQLAEQSAKRGELPGTEASVSRLEGTDFDFEARQKYNSDPFFSQPVVRAGVKGYENFKQGILGLNEFAADFVGADNLAESIRKGGKDSRGFTEAMGTPTNRAARNFEGAVSSVAMQLPELIAGAATGSSALTLSAMFMKAFGSEYSDGKERGLDQDDAAKRAALMGAFEVIGERFGLGKQLDMLRSSARGVDTNMLSEWMANTIKKEVPGELLTTTGQFGVDKMDGIGLNQKAGLKDYIEQVGDTVLQTVIQGGIMSAGAGTVNGLRRGRPDDGSNEAEAQRQAALNRWATNGLTTGAQRQRQVADIVQPTQAPEVTIADISSAETVDDAINAAAEIVSRPIQTSELPTAADIDALEAQYDINPVATDLPAVDGSVRGDRLAGGIEPGIQQQATETGALLDGAIAGAEVAQVDGAAGVPSADRTVDAQPALESYQDESGETWWRLPADAGVRTVPRSEMPSIPSTARGALVNFLSARGIPHQTIEVNPASLNLLQQEASLERVDRAKDFKGIGQAVLVSNDGYVLDGHHQVLAAEELGKDVRAIVLDAPIEQLLDETRQFPSASIDGKVVGAPDITPMPVEQPKKKRTSTEATRQRVAKETPLLEFLARHGVSIEDRSDTGGQKGKGGNVMVPGYGPMYRKAGLRLDELAQLAVQEGFLTQRDIENEFDTGGTRKLAELIERAAHRKEPIGRADQTSDLDNRVNDELMNEAVRLGIEINGKSIDQIYDEVVARHAESFTEQEVQELIRFESMIDIEAATIEQQEQAEETTNEEAANQEVAQDRTGEVEANTAEPSQERGAEVEREAQPEILGSYTAEEVEARNESDRQVAQAKRKEQSDAEKEDRDRLDAAETERRIQDSAENFELGQDANDAASGQRNAFSTNDEAEVHIPKAFYRRVQVQIEVWVNETERFKNVTMSADRALEGIREDIDLYEKMLKCMRG
jgi:hypothetical protein